MNPPQNPPVDKLLTHATSLFQLFRSNCLDLTALPWFKLYSYELITLEKCLKNVLMLSVYLMLSCFQNLVTLLFKTSGGEACAMTVRCLLKHLGNTSCSLHPPAVAPPSRGSSSTSTQRSFTCLSPSTMSNKPSPTQAAGYGVTSTAGRFWELTGTFSSICTHVTSTS